MDRKSLNWLVLFRTCRSLLLKLELLQEHLVSSHVLVSEQAEQVRISRHLGLSQEAVLVNSMLDGTLAELVFEGSQLPRENRKRILSIAASCREVGRILVAAQAMDSSESLGRDLSVLSETDYRLLRGETLSNIRRFAQALVQTQPCCWGMTREAYQNRFIQHVCAGLITWVDIRYASLDRAWNQAIEHGIEYILSQLQAEQDEFSEVAHQARSAVRQNLPALLERIYAINGISDVIGQHS